jgi:phenylalanyl-tRNA synthetase alpha chain
LETKQSFGLEEKTLKDDQELLEFNPPKIGHLHPITETINKMNKIFLSMGYSIIDGPEIEEDEYCFKRLNVPADHPARAMQDTIYLKEPNIMLRTQMSSVEARTLANFKPPFKVVTPGRIYRNEKANKSNHFIFHHYQGVVVLKKVSLKDLFGTINLIFKKMYGPDVVVRYRNKYYPEVEPGVGPDMQCFSCKGKGCSLCKGVGWIEMGGAGIIHPNVMKMAGIDTKEWMGFAFGLGLDRWVMARYHITDIRTLLGGNLGYKYYENEGNL